MQAKNALVFRCALLSFCSFAILVGCAPMDDEPFDPSEREIVGLPSAVDAPRGVYVKGTQDAELTPFTPHAEAAPRHRIIYMNKDGGTYTPGNSDAVANRSSIVSWTASVPPWNVSDEGWAEVMDCMREIWAPFDVEITDVDPGPVDHIESVVAGRPQDVGMGSGVGGVSPFDCGVIERSVVFTFAVVYGSDYRSICETAAQEVAHSFGLEHEFMCEDPMTYLSGCGEKTFQNVAAKCGEYSARRCDCGGYEQNSVEMLLGHNGPRPTDPTDPPPEPEDPLVPDGFDDDPAPGAPEPGTDPGTGGSDLGPVLGGCGIALSPAGPSGFAILLAAGLLAVRRRRRNRA